MARRNPFRQACTALALGVWSAAALAGHTPMPASVTFVGSLQSELGCAGDWDPSCGVSGLVYDAGDLVWQATFALPAGNWEYKAALNGSWDENYGAMAQPNGANIGLGLATSGSVKFYYDHASHWITDNVNARIVTAAGSFQSELGCAGDWDPGCLRSWLQDPDGDGVYEFETSALAVGAYEVKAALWEGWDENYGAGGTANGANIGFAVGEAGQTVRFSFVSATNLLTVQVGDDGGGGQVPEPGALALALLALAGVGAVSRRALPGVKNGS